MPAASTATAAPSAGKSAEYTTALPAALNFVTNIAVPLVSEPVVAGKSGDIVDPREMGTALAVGGDAFREVLTAAAQMCRVRQHRVDDQRPAAVVRGDSEMNPMILEWQ